MAELPHRQISRFGWKPSLPDPRDHVANTATLKIAVEVDPRKAMSEPYDQGQLGSCTGNAIAGCVEYDASLNKAAFGVPSRLFIYYGERVIEGTVSQDSGAYGRDGFKVAKTLGVPPETDWPYDTNRFTEKPPAKAYSDAAKHKIKSYVKVPQSQASVQRVLSNRQTVAFGFSVFESFEGDEIARTGIMPVPGPGERMLGGHEVLIVGYLKQYPHHALVRNSWGPGWGLGGYFLFPWQVLLDPNMADDFRTIPRPAGK